MSTRSPARTRLATSTPPPASVLTACPVAAWKSAASWRSTSRVAMEEISVSGFWGMGNLIAVDKGERLGRCYLTVIRTVNHHN